MSIKVRQSIFTLVILLGAGWWLPPSTTAQDAPPNLLVNGDLESPYLFQDIATRTVPQGWNLWIGAGAPDAIPNTAEPQVRSGAVSWHIRQDGEAFTAAGYQTVTGITPGNRLRLSAFGWVFTCDDPDNRCVSAEPPYFQSTPTAGAALRVGIDPTGGVDPLAATVQWSAPVAPYDQWVEMHVTATAQSDSVTVFLFMTQANGLALNNVYWDSASLVVTDEPDTGSDEVPFVVPQGVQPDGSIIHIIQAGDTLWSIAYAYIDYGVTVESIAALNEGITPRTRFLQQGQPLLILPPGSVDPVSGQLVSAASSPQPQPTPTATTRSTMPAAAAPTGSPEPSLIPSPTASPTAPPTPTPTVTPTPQPTATIPDALVARTGALCVAAYEDENQNGRRDPEEGPLAGLQIVITGTDSSEQLVSDEMTDPLCVDMPPATYDVLAMPPGGFGLTTPDVLRVTVMASRRVSVAFGAAAGHIPPTVSAAATNPTAEPAEPGVVAPLIAIEATDDEAGDTVLDTLYENSGLIVLALAGLIGVGSALALLAVRRPR